MLCSIKVDGAVAIKDYLPARPAGEIVERAHTPILPGRILINLKINSLKPITMAMN